MFLKKMFFFYFIFLNIFILATDPSKHVIGSIGRRQGLFALFFNVLNHLDWCERNKKKLVVYLAQPRYCAYYQYGGFKGETNPWEYYFEPISDLKYEINDPIIRKYFAPDGTGIPFYDIDSKGNKFFCMDLKFKWWANRLIEKYIKIKPYILNIVDSYVVSNFAGKKTIGIHIRGTDKKLEVPPIPLSEIFNKANEFEGYQFFVATDEQRILEDAKVMLNNNVIFYNCRRSINGQPLLPYQSKILAYNAAQNGEDVLVEALLLSKCDKLIHTCSNVSAAAVFFNPNIENILLKPK